MNEIIKQLSGKLSDDAIQRTKGTETKKGYDTTGYGYQYAVDRFNDILGEDWGYDWNIIHEREGAYKSGMPFIEITVQVSIWINKKENSRSCVGGHTGKDYADALKGAITNGFKKTAAFWGVGRDAFAGTIDDDNKPLPDLPENKTEQSIKDLFDGTEVLTANQVNAKLKALPDKIKEGLKLLGWTKKQIWDKCEMYSWNNDKILADINSLLDK